MKKLNPAHHTDRIRTDVGLVLRRLPHLDEDLRLHLLLRHHGKVIVNAKGGQKLHSKLKSLVEPFTESEIHVFLLDQKIYGRLLSGKLLHSHGRLRLNYQAYHLACQAVEIVDALLPFRAPSEDVFDHLKRFLNQLEEGGAAERIWVQFGVDLLKDLGHGDMTLVLHKTPPEKHYAYLMHRFQEILPWRLKSEGSPPSLS